MKKHGFLLTTIALVLAVGLGLRLYETKKTIDVFSLARQKQETMLGSHDTETVLSLKGKGTILDSQSVGVLKDAVKGDKEQVLAQLVKKTLLEMHHKSWLEDPTLEAKYFFGNIYKDMKEEFILAVNRGKDLAMLFVFTETKDGHELVTRIRGLAPITGLDLVGIPGFPYKGLVVEEYLDEMTGGFFEARTQSVYLFREGRPHKVWERVKYLKEYYPQGGQLKGDETQWWMNTEEAEIKFSDKGQITVKSKIREEKSEILGDMAGPYEVVTERETEETYLWNPKELVFKLVN